MLRLGSEQKEGDLLHSKTPLGCPKDSSYMLTRALMLGYLLFPCKTVENITHEAFACQQLPSPNACAFER